MAPEHSCATPKIKEHGAKHSSNATQTNAAIVDGQQDGTNGVGNFAHDREYQKGYVNQVST